jgi:predicted ATPase
MLFNTLRVRGFRSIVDSDVLKLGPISLVVGRNNSGKSSLLRAIYSIQNGSPFQQSDIRVGQDQAEINLTFPELPPPLLSNENLVKVALTGPDGPGTLNCTRRRNAASWTIEATINNSSAKVAGLASQEPDNLIFPVLSGRRITIYKEQVSDKSAFAVGPTDNNLVSRIMSLATGSIPESVRFRELCRSVLGINIDVLPGENGQSIGVQVDRYTSIPLEAMGAGLSGTLSLLAGLSVANDKLFIIEEPEDDLHPAALKALMDAIAISSESNQFLISTHNSTVLTRLSGLPELKIFHVESDEAIPPSSTFSEIVDVNDRINVLQDLGYGLADLDLGEGWLIFEESSAELLIRQYLGPWFAPGVTKLRTLGAQGVSRVGPLFQDFREMFLFAYLEPIYRNRAWVIVDGDQPGREVVAKLRQDFGSWPANHFRNWTKEQFELYYPPVFAGRVQDVLAIQNKQQRREAKKQLLDQVIAWIEQDAETARIEFKQSAAEVIEVLREIEAELAAL